MAARSGGSSTTSAATRAFPATRSFAGASGATFYLSSHTGDDGALVLRLCDGTRTWRGELRPHDLTPPKQWLAAKDGGFLYIGGFQMKAPFVGGGLTTVASQAIQELLTLKQLRYRYTVVAYIAEGRELEADPYGRGPRPVMRDPWAEPTAEEKLQMQKAWLRRVESDCRPFIRANFKEITHPKASEGWLYTTRTLQWRNAVVGGKYRGVQALPMLSHAQAMRVPLQASAKLASGTQPVPTPTELDCELHRTVYGREGPVKTDVIERLVKRGANIFSHIRG